MPIVYADEARPRPEPQPAAMREFDALLPMPQAARSFLSRSAALS